MDNLRKCSVMFIILEVDWQLIYLSIENSLYLGRKNAAVNIQISFNDLNEAR